METRHNPLPSTAGGEAAVVLVVDDDPTVRQTIAWALEDEGFTVETAADGQQAVARATARRPALMVLDLSLPVLQGHEVAASVRAVHGSGLPIVVVTADGNAASKAERVGAVS